MNSWEKIPIGQLFSLERGSLQSTKCSPGKYTFITASSDWKTHNEYSHDCEALIYAVAASGSLGRCHYFKGKFISSDLCFIMRAKDEHTRPINYRFYQNVFSFLKKDIVSKTKAGTSKESISQKRFSEYKLPYINFKHQTLWETKLNKLNEYAEQMDIEATSQASCLFLLRQSILQKAIEGKLTESWRKKNPVRKGDPETDAAALLDKIKAEKQKLIVEGMIRKEKPLAPIKPEEVPFEMPKGWVWCRLEGFGYLMGGGTPSTANPEYWGGKVPWVSPKDMKQEIIDDSIDHITELGLEESSTKLIPTGSVLFVVRGMILAHTFPVGINVKPVSINQDMKALIPYVLSSNLYIMKMLKGYSQIILGLTNTSTHGTKRLEYSESYARLPYPLPPLAEQKAIVERVDRLMTMVDELEKQVGERKVQAEQLMQAVLREAFNV